MQDWGPPMLELIKKLGGLKFVLGVLAVVVLLPLVATIGAVGAAFGTVGGAIALAVAGSGAAIAAVIANWEDLKAAFFDSKVGGFLSETFNAMGGTASLQSASVAAAQFAPGAVVPGASQSSNVDVNIKIDQDGRVTGVEPETGSAVKVTSESLNGEAF